MLAMSSGLRSARRLTALSWLEAFWPPDADVIALASEAMAASLTICPSMTNSGEADALIEEMPRSCTCTPPPGAPELEEIVAPATLPASALSTVSCGTSLSCSLLTVEIALAAFCCEICVALPVTTSSCTCR